MRYKQSAGKIFQALASSASGDIPKISQDPFSAKEIDKVYFAYPQFLLECLDEQVRKKLYLPWEEPGKFEALRLHLAITHHWRLEEVRLLKVDELLDLLRPDLMALQLDSADVQSILERLDDLAELPIREDLLARSQRD